MLTPRDATREARAKLCWTRICPRCGWAGCGRVDRPPSTAGGTPRYRPRGTGGSQSTQCTVQDHVSRLPGGWCAGLEFNLAIALGHRGAHHRLQFHHVFPKAVLKSSYTSREADDIANLAFIGGKSNRQISDKAPETYFHGYIAKAGLAAFEAQCIPIDPALLAAASYKEFLAERRRRISRRLNEFLGTVT
ncbi:MAG: hypothetical protein MZV63_36240 [Marinilabiliales bacterium]|nr:hypothetical protein [Marinilabiliales bacterium]